MRSTRPAAGATYKPSYVPPVPAPVKKKETIDVDTSGVRAETVVKHKAFGTGQVQGIDGAILVVDFKGNTKKFQFPGAFEQGFLKIEES